MIVDAHHHLWDPAVRGYAWMIGEAAALARPFGLADLLSELATTPVQMTVVVQAVADVAETRELLAVAEQSSGVIAGVVGWVDLTGPDVRDELEHLMASAGGPLLVGVRHQVHDEADPSWLARDDVRRGLRAVRDLGLVFDLLVRSNELPAAIDVSRAMPDLVFVLDHLAKPPISRGEFEPWSELLRDLATGDNVHCKLSGLVTEASPGVGDGNFQKYVDHALAVFGADRIMYGSDWPVCTLRRNYGEVYELAGRLTASLTRSEHDGFFGENAIKTYGLV